MSTEPEKPGEKPGTGPGGGGGYPGGGQPGGGYPGGKPGDGGNGAPYGRTYVVVRGDSLSLISGKFYGDVLLWPVIYDANKKVVGGNPNLIQPSQRLSIPPIGGYSKGQLDAIRQRGRNC
jgi:nucleoid-associated protein YgaU